MKSSPPSTLEGQGSSPKYVFLQSFTFSRKRDITSTSTFLAPLLCIAFLDTTLKQNDGKCCNLDCKILLRPTVSIKHLLHVAQWLPPWAELQHNTYVRVLAIKNCISSLNTSVGLKCDSVGS